MQVILTARHVQLTDEFKEYLTDKVSKLVRFYDRIIEIDAIVDLVSGMHEVELIVRADHKNRFVGKERHSDPYAASDLVIDTLARQLARHKEKHRNRKHPARNGRMPIAESSGGVEPITDTGGGEEPAT